MKTHKSRWDRVKLAERHMDAAIKLARSMTGPDTIARHDAESAAMEALWLATGTSKKDVGKFWPYAYHKIRGAILNELRKSLLGGWPTAQKNGEPIPRADQYPDEFDPAACEPSDDDDLTRSLWWLDDAMGRIPPNWSQSIRLIYGIGTYPHSHREAAERIGLTPNSATRAMMRGVDRLREIAIKDGLTVEDVAA